jgi:hypothetical protein
VPARLNLGLALYRLGDRGGARQAWLLCQERDPANPQVAAFLALIDQDESRA